MSEPIDHQLAEGDRLAHEVARAALRFRREERNPDAGFDAFCEFDRALDSYEAFNSERPNEDPITLYRKRRDT